MKKLILAVFAATTLATFQAAAVLVTVDQVAGYHASDGEFNVSPVQGAGYGTAPNAVGSGSDLYNNNSGALGFGTFCVARFVGITPIPGQYNATIFANGVNPVSGDQISLGTAWLFQRFAQGVLANYNYVPGPVPTGRAQSAYFLQLAIWTLEGQYSYIGNPNGGNIFLIAAESMFGSLAAASLDNNQTFKVGVLGLTSPNGAPAQSMLTLLPPVVPDGGSALFLLGMGLSGLALISRKMRA